MSSNKYTVRLLSLAEQDLHELITYVAAENVTAALTLADNIEKKTPHVERASLARENPQ